VESRDARDDSFASTRFSEARADVICAGHLCPRDLASPSPRDTTRKSVPLGRLVFDYWGSSFGLLFAGMVLAPGTVATLPVYHPLRGVILLDVSVGDSAQRDRGDGRMVTAFAVRVRQQPGFLYYVSREAPYWVSLDLTRPDGSRQEYRRSAFVDSGRRGRTAPSRRQPF
jgi:hypothetical protein